MTRKRVCVEVFPSTLSLGIHRVAEALRKYAPDWVELVPHYRDADLWVRHVIGHGSMQEPLLPGQEMAMIQYCLNTSENPHPEAWLPYWSQARAVWSYYDIPKQVATLGTMQQCTQFGETVNFYYAPLGVDASVFEPARPARKRFAVGTSGFIADTESVREVYKACRHVGGQLFHLGPDLELGFNVTYAHRVADDVLAEFWSQCTYVAGLRRIEGFELPVIEGFLCGARPIIFDKPHYTDWFGDFAEIVPEASPEEVTEALIQILSKPVKPVTPGERSQVARRFDWHTIVTGFWEALR